MFEPHPDAEARRRSAITLIKAILPLDLYEKHKRKFLRNCLCKLTEAEGGKGRRRKKKYNLRFLSSEAEHASESELRHEHVYRCNPMVDLLMQANPAEIDEIIADAIGCTVTKAEHKELDKVDRRDPKIDGWKRYERAGIVVIDQTTGKPHPL
jgi:hypothetical protein